MINVILMCFKGHVLLERIQVQNLREPTSHNAGYTWIWYLQIHLLAVSSLGLRVAQW